MKFKYNLTKKDYKKILYEKNASTNVIYIVFMSLFFLIITIDFIVYNPVVIFVFYLIYILILLFILFVLNRILTNLIVKLNEKNLGVRYGTYECELKKDGLIETLDDFKCEIRFDDIRKIKYKKNTIMIYSKSKPISLIFKKGLFEKEELFDKFEQKLKEKVIITK